MSRLLGLTLPIYASAVICLPHPSAGTGVVTNDSVISLVVDGSVTMEFVRLPFGVLKGLQGLPHCAVWWACVNDIPMTNVLWMGKYEVSQRQWMAVMFDNPSYNRGADMPVESVRVQDVRDFLYRLHGLFKRQGYSCRLPLEYEWEYACRAGSTNAHAHGEDDSALAAYAWYSANSSGTTHHIGTRRANLWGLHDMQGNVLELVDCNAYTVATDATSPSSGSEDDELLVCRGGSCCLDPLQCRCSARTRVSAAGLAREPSMTVGLRIVCEPTKPIKSQDDKLRPPAPALDKGTSGTF